MGKQKTDKDLHSGLWIREDGALCWGENCLTIKPDGKNLRIAIDEKACPVGTREKWEELLNNTLGKGGKAIFEVPVKIEKD